MISDRPGVSPAQLALSLGALGVVYGDIGTSPLYAMRECFGHGSGINLTEANVLGVLSLITWSLVLVVTFKFLLLVLRADNKGEGGLLALAHLVVPHEVEDWRKKHWILLGIGLFGAALLFGDGIITPALSVLSAVEGLEVATPALGPYVVPIALAILSLLFAAQRLGTARVGQFFGPIALIWFGVLGVLGAVQIAHNPSVLWALSPGYAVGFFINHGLHGTLVLGAVFLTITGAEALYADLGHFGIRPIQISWFGLVFPALLLNYFGQGALLIRQPELVESVFYQMAPSWAVLPLVALSTLATIIASQAVISGVFSLSSQAVQLSYLPRLTIHHTSPAHVGQIYVPAANGLLWAGTTALVLAFRSSSGLADAYGIAVSLTMLITTVLMGFVMVERWRWSILWVVPLMAAFLLIDVAFLSAILPKVANGGWIPLSIATVLVIAMAIWRRGRQIVVRERPHVPPVSVPPPSKGALVYLVRDASQVVLDADAPPILLHVKQCHLPFMDEQDHVVVEIHEDHVSISACFGFMETPDIPALLSDLPRQHVPQIDTNTRYVWIREQLPDYGIDQMHPWLRGLFRLMSRHAASIPQRFRLPLDQVIEVTPPVLPSP